MAKKSNLSWTQPVHCVGSLDSDKARWRRVKNRKQLLSERSNTNAKHRPEKYSADLFILPGILLNSVKIGRSFLEHSSYHTCLSYGHTQSAFYRTKFLNTGKSISLAEGCQMFDSLCLSFISRFTLVSI